MFGPERRSEAPKNPRRVQARCEAVDAEDGETALVGDAPDSRPSVQETKREAVQ